MRDNIRKTTSQTFENIQQIDANNNQFWYARDLQKIFDYEGWENFENAINKAKISCEAAGFNCADHFRDVTKMVQLDSNSERQIQDIMLTRYACYLMVQNGDPSKPAIANGQTYFAIQAMRQELRKNHKKSISDLAFNLFCSTQAEDKLKRDKLQGKAQGNQVYSQVREKVCETVRELGGVEPKNLAAEITNHNVEKNNLNEEIAVTQEHVQNVSSVRNILVERVIKPENLPVSEDIKTRKVI